MLTDATATLGIVGITAFSTSIVMLTAYVLAERGHFFMSKLQLAGVTMGFLAVSTTLVNLVYIPTPQEAGEAQVVVRPSLKKAPLRKVDVLAMRATELAGEAREMRLRVDGRASATRMNEAMEEARFYSGLQNKTEEIQRRQAHEEEKQTIIEAYLDAVGSEN